MLASVLLSSGASYPPQSSEIWFVIGVGAPRFFLGVFLGPRLVHCLVLLRTRQQLIVLASVLLSSDATSPPQSPDTLVVMGVGAPRFFLGVFFGPRPVHCLVLLQTRQQNQAAVDRAAVSWRAESPDVWFVMGGRRSENFLGVLLGLRLVFCLVVQ